jgi:uncharacterized protein (TIGR02449 family)
MIMEELLQDLEKKIKELIDNHGHLKQTNRQLQLSQALAAGEKEQLLARQQRAISQIETLVSRLKAIEELS